MSVTKETITVTYVGKFGPRVGETWYPLSSKSGLKPENFEKGKTYNVLIYTSGTGKKYINQIVGENVTEVIVPKDKPVNIEALKAGDDKLLQLMKDSQNASPLLDKPKSRDFDAEARGKVACACLCAAVSSPGLAMYATSLKEYVQIVKDTAEGMIEKVFEHQKGK